MSRSIALLVAVALLAFPSARVSGQTGDATLVAAVLPSSRSATIGVPVTAFVSVVNAGPSTVERVGVFLRTPIPATVVFQTTDPATNVPTSVPGVTVRLGPGSTQTFVIAVRPTAAFLCSSPRRTQCWPRSRTRTCCESSP